jgi:hypothetical protein
MSYTLVPTLMRLSAKRSIRKVSMVFGCRPSARPVLVWSGRSSIIFDATPKRARFSLSHPGVSPTRRLRGKCITNSRQHQTRRSSTHYADIHGFAFVPVKGLDVLLDCSWCHCGFELKVNDELVYLLRLDDRGYGMRIGLYVLGFKCKSSSRLLCYTNILTPVIPIKSMS